MVTALDFDKALLRLTGITCWGTVAGGSAGSAVAMDFGGRRSRPKPLRLPHLTPEQQEFLGEVSILIRCAWRLETDATIVCGSADDNSADGSMLRGLTQVVGATVHHVEIAPDRRDLTIAFDRDLRLRVFCDNSDPERDNYVVYVDDHEVFR